MQERTHYLDHNASAPLLPGARAALCAGLEMHGNPSSVHGSGRALRALVDKGRGEVADLVGATRAQVVFTGSATEAITQALVGGAKALAVDLIITSAGEHKAVLEAAEASGKPVEIIGLDGEGTLQMEALLARLDGLDAAGQVALVAIHAVNNETGVVQPIEEIERRVGPSPHFLFVDGVQALGKMDIGFAARAVDMMAFSAHKIAGPAGIGALIVKGHCNTVRLIPGGGQEMGRRGGTEAAALIAGFGAAAVEFTKKFDAADTSALAKALEAGISALAPDAVFFGTGSARLAHTVNFAVPGLKNSVAMMALDLEGIEVSSGSACASGKVGRSHVLESMGIAPDLVACGLRVSFGWSSTKEDVAAFLAAFERLLARASQTARQGLPEGT